MATPSQKTPNTSSTAISITPPTNSAANSTPPTSSTAPVIPSYLQELKKLEPAYPALKGLVGNADLYDSAGGDTVKAGYEARLKRLPGRCAVLTFNEDDVLSETFLEPKDLDSFLDRESTAGAPKQCRLFILEDLQSEWVNVLGGRLGVDPLVFSEQMNTWHYTNSMSIPTRTLPSMVRPEKSFTLRYYEPRQLVTTAEVSHLSHQMTWAVNRRRYDRWRDVDTPSITGTIRYRHGFVRRCASFWTSQVPGIDGWDSVMLVDPAFDSFEWRFPLESSSPSSSNTCTILKGKDTYPSLAKLWAARAWENKDFLSASQSFSQPYHAASTTLVDASMNSQDEKTRADVLKTSQRNLGSPLDEIVFHWTQVADKKLRVAARLNAAESNHYLLKYVCNQWVNLLELIASGVNESEFYADDHQANIDTEQREDKSVPVENWRAQLKRITKSTNDINYQRRILHNFEQALALNMERMGLASGTECSQPNVPQAIKDAQRDFTHLRNRLLPYIDRVAGLANIANDLANLHTAFRSIKDSERGLRLSLFASVVFPMTLVTSMLSMGEDYLPGKREFWVFWAASIPLVFLTAAALLPKQPLTYAQEYFRKREAKRTTAAVRP